MDDIEKAFWTSKTPQEYKKYLGICRRLEWNYMTIDESRFYDRINREFQIMKHKIINSN